MEHAIRPGNVCRDAANADPSHVNLYLGNGRFGGCFGWHGLQHRADVPEAERGISKTVLCHADHWTGGRYGLDYWLPVARLTWASGERIFGTARQHLELYAGTLTTRHDLPGDGFVEITITFDTVARDLMGVRIRYRRPANNDLPALRLVPETSIRGHYDNGVEATVSATVESRHTWVGRIRAGSADSLLRVTAIGDEVACTIKGDEQGAHIELVASHGDVLLLIGCAGATRASALKAQFDAALTADAFFQCARANWKVRWGDAFIDLPDKRLQALWARSVFYILASYAPDVRAPAAPMGWSGNGWPFHFPQDVSYIHPALLRLGHLDIGKAIVESYRVVLDEVCSTTKRIYNRPGAMWPWEHPIASDFGERLLADEAPNPFQFEIHNAAYPARMACETAAHLQDPIWAREIAWPIVRESARFLGSIARRRSGGTWSVQVTPSMGQDEFGGENASNYLCALFATRYALQAAIRMAGQLEVHDPELPRWQAILADGLAFDRLLDPAVGLRATAENLVGSPWLGRQKHPVQLNAVTFLPLGGQVDPPTHLAYTRRHELCAGMDSGTSYGWTLAAYWLAASNLGDAAGLSEELARMESMRYVDRDWIQIYETSGALHAPYYLTSHGLYVQSLCNAFVNDYWGQNRIASAVPSAWDGARYMNLRTADGERHSGSWRAGAAEGRPITTNPNLARPSYKTQQRAPSLTSSTSRRSRTNI